LLSDLHLGKVTHFRKAGIAVPQAAAEDTLLRLEVLCNSFELERVLLLGDLFHSDHNHEWLDFQSFVARYHFIKFELVMGNHDLFSTKEYTAAGLVCHTELLDEPPFTFTHDRFHDSEYFNIYGHIHPAVRLFGKAKQAIRLPCYFFRRQEAILPAFGTFTGNHTLKYGLEDNIFVIAESEVIKVNS